MKKFLVVMGFFVCCSSGAMEFSRGSQLPIGYLDSVHRYAIGAMEFRRGSQLPIGYLDSVHRYAIAVNKSERDISSSVSYHETDAQGSMCIEEEDSVICAFPEEGLANYSEEEIANSLSKRFYDKEIIVTGYRKGGEFAASVASALTKRLIGINQIKSITFCSSQPQADLSDIALTCRLNFAHSYSRVFYRSNMLESLIPWTSEIRSRLSKKNVLLWTIGLAQTVLSMITIKTIMNFDQNERTSTLYATSFALGAGGVSCIYKASKSFLKTPRYLPIVGVRRAFERLKNRSLGAMDERELREAGVNSFFWYLLCLSFDANAENVS